MPRTDSHSIETKTRNKVRQLIDDYNGGDALVRELTERDYGIDFLLELFEAGYPSGKVAFLQVKGTGKEIEKLKNSDEVSCPNVSSSNIDYARQNRIPCILIYISSLENHFYYIDLNLFANKLSQDNNEQKSFSIRIPFSNRADRDNLDGFMDLVRSYYPENNS